MLTRSILKKNTTLILVFAICTYPSRVRMLGLASLVDGYLPKSPNLKVGTDILDYLQSAESLYSP